VRKRLRPIKLLVPHGKCCEPCKARGGVPSAADPSSAIVLDLFVETGLDFLQAGSRFDRVMVRVQRQKHHAEFGNSDSFYVSTADNPTRLRQLSVSRMVPGNIPIKVRHHKEPGLSLSSESAGSHLMLKR
jgi:hypothetical protein